MKLSPLAIYALGLMVGLIALFWGLFWQFIPNSKDTAAYQANTELQEAESAKQGQAEKKVQKALAMVKAKDEQWQQVVALRTPPKSVAAGGIDLSVNSQELAVDTKIFRNNVQRALDVQLKKGGVEVLSAPFVPLPGPDETNSLLASFYNYPAIKFPVVIFDFGTITVRGTYQQIMNHLRAYKSMPHYLAVSDGLALTGTTPLMTGTYNLSVVGFIRGDKIFPSVPEAAAASSGGGGGPRGFGGGGAFPGGGLPSGMPGMPGAGRRPGAAAGGGGGGAD